MGAYNFTNSCSDVASPSLYIDRNLPVAPEGCCHKITELLCLWIRRGEVIITITYNKIFALCPAPLQSEPC